MSILLAINRFGRGSETCVRKYPMILSKISINYKGKSWLVLQLCHFRWLFLKLIFKENIVGIPEVRSPKHCVGNSDLKSLVVYINWLVKNLFWIKQELLNDTRCFAALVVEWWKNMAWDDKTSETGCWKHGSELITHQYFCLVFIALPSPPIHLVLFVWWNKPVSPERRIKWLIHNHQCGGGDQKIRVKS